MEDMEKGIVRKYWRTVFACSRDEAREIFGSKGGMVKATVFIITLGFITAVSVFLGLEKGWQNEIDTIRNLLIGEAFLALVLFLATPVVAIFKMPKVAAEMNKEKTQQIARLMEAEPPELEKLSDLRNWAVRARNDGMNIKTEEQVDEFIKEYTKWVKRVRRQMKKISPAQASYFQSLNRYTPEAVYPNAINSSHRKHLQIYDERIRRLETFLNTHFGYKQGKND